jgi:hypothetical protein
MLQQFKAFKGLAKRYPSLVFNFEEFSVQLARTLDQKQDVRGSIPRLVKSNNLGQVMHSISTMPLSTSGDGYLVQKS